MMLIIVSIANVLDFIYNNDEYASAIDAIDKIPNVLQNTSINDKICNMMCRIIITYLDNLMPLNIEIYC